jgi:hypothetical protein
MGLARYALVFGLGYAAGHPAGRKQLKALPAQLRALANRPEAKQVQEKGKAVAGKAVETAKERLGRTSSSTDSTRPAVVEETVVVTGTKPTPVLTDDHEAAAHGTLPPGPRH